MRRDRRTILDRFDELERTVDNFFEDIFSLEPMWDIREGSLKPLYEIKKGRETIVLLIDLPYVKKEAIQLRVEEKSVDVSADLIQPIRFDRWGSAQRECDFKRLWATIPLPCEVDSDRCLAKFSGGVLTVELPKKTKAKAIKID